jgi:hypothetical protein
MAAFCTKCGSSLGSSTGFCPACGTPIATPAAATAVPVQAAAPAAYVAPPVAYTAPPVQGPPVYGQPPAGYPVGPQKSTSALKIILIVVLVVIALGVLGLGAMGFMAWRLAKSVHVDQNGGNVTMTSPGGGSMSIGDTTATDADLGVPAYPGATREKGGMNLNSGSASMVMAHFTTSDSESQVVDYYKGKMGDGVAVVSTGDGTVLNSGGKDTNRIMVTVGPGSGDDAGKTTIVIMHTQKK